MPFYAVARGRTVGIFNTWKECENQVKGFPRASFKKFSSENEARDFINGKYIPAKKKPRLEMVNFANKINEEEEKLENMFLELTEETPPTSSPSPKRKFPGGDIKFQPPEPTTEKLYNSIKFHEDAKGFVHVYTDGSCLNNGKYTAAAGFGVFFGDNHPLNVSDPITGRPTNNVSEKTGSPIELRLKRLNIFTDSQFLINSVCKWMSGWKRKEWKLASGKSVVNKKDFIKLDELIESGTMVIQWSYVPAHKNIHGNEEADKLAKLGASRYLTKKEREEEAEYFTE